MYPRLFDFSKNESDYFLNYATAKLLKFGYGNFTQIESSEVRRNLQCEYTLTMTIYKSDPLAKVVVPGMCILCPQKPNSINWQIFVIRNINLQDETLEISADHVKYIFLNNVLIDDPYGIPDVITGSMGTVLAEVFKIENNIPVNTFFKNDFQVYATNDEIAVDIGGADYSTIGELIVNSADSVCKQSDTWLDFDNFSVTFKKLPTGNTPIKEVIKYGSNLSSYGQGMSNESEFTHIIPYATVDTKNTYEGNVESVKLYGTDSPLATGASSQFTRVKMIDFSYKFKSSKGYVIPDGAGAGTGYTEVRTRLKNYGLKYIQSHPELSNSSVSIRIDVAEELINLDLDLGDKVKVVYDPTDYSHNHIVTETIYDPLTNRYKSITVGERKYTLYNFLKGGY